MQTEITTAVRLKPDTYSFFDYFGYKVRIADRELNSYRRTWCGQDAEADFHDFLLESGETWFHDEYISLCELLRLDAEVA